MYAFTRRAAEEHVSAETSCEIAHKAHGNVGEFAANITIQARAGLRLDQAFPR
jgi:hypothetical protein